MSQEEFWNSNPRIIAVWEQIYKDEMNYKNSLVHSLVGTYGISALTFAIEHCLSGKKARSKYLDKPIEIFPEKKKDVQVSNAQMQFKAWAESMIKNYKGKEVKNGITDN